MSKRKTFESIGSIQVMISLRVMSLILLLIALMGALSCVSFAKNKYNDYEHPVSQTISGKFAVGLSPESKLIQEGNNQIEIFGAPYYFNAQYYTSEETFLNGEIRNLEIRSLKTGNVVFKRSLIIDICRTSEKWSHHVFKQKRTMGFGGGVSLNIPYHDYRVLFDFRVYKEDGLVFDEGRVDIVVKRDYYEGHVRKGAGIL